MIDVFCYESKAIFSNKIPLLIFYRPDDRMIFI